MILKRIISIFIVISFLFFPKNVLSNECITKNKIKVGLIENDYIDYKYYIYYVLSNYSLKKNLEYEFEIANNNLDEFDIIFGEHSDLNRLSLRDLELPSKIKEFYNKNEIKISNNILPLDLDTFIILGDQKYNELNLEGFSNIVSPNKYTLGLSFLRHENIINLIMYNSELDSVDINNFIIESNISSLKKIFKNMNNNVIGSDYSEVYNSYKNFENIFTLFSDGILLYKNNNTALFKKFPKSKYTWDEENGVFINNNYTKPTSFFGFSAYINNINNIGLICYMIEPDIRLKAFRDFNIQLSPLSIIEVKKIINDIPDDYKEILKNKNKYIKKPNYEKNYIQYNEIKDIIFNKTDYINLIDKNNLLN